jgi:hypothetical protein
MMRGVASFASLALGLALGACSSDAYVYSPTTNTNATLEGKPAAAYPIPPERPTGDVRIASIGFADLAAKGVPEAGKVRSIHVREIVENDSRAPWTIDTREQRLTIDEGDASRAAFARADPGSTGPPLVQVAPGATRAVDLFFPVPAPMSKARTLPAFDAVWTVTTDQRVVIERTPLERIEHLPRYAGDEAYGAYWYDPAYPSGAFKGAAVPPALIGHPLVVEQAPARPVRRVARGHP